ncbi:unnamed protein product [Dracunculus medinensis]|uniref:Pepsin-I3 domain-containing protein n=1 Tax=Dracunculus medinensis TaxID=318479 RepID=A0A0N4UI46_DRAME|nr:unnamed protein product [Dracunculus medinensis]
MIMITITTTSGNDLAMTTKQLIQQAHKEKISKASLVASHKNLLDGPARPSFCSLNDTLPVFLDGCMIQNNKIYVGRDYVRDLTPEETQELKDYIMKKREFQKYLAATINQLVQPLFSRTAFDFFNLFSDSRIHKTTTETTTTTETAIKQVEEPVAPDFCTAIY